MKVDKNNRNIRENEFIEEWVEKWEKKGFRKHIIDGLPYLFPSLVNRPRCFTYGTENGCIYCGNKTFRYYSKVSVKKYYQCEKCGGINH
ncbi:hypothetical protein BEH94_03430 [Candidatus Altiarchaeales archaeon WOR_SM1_SCG]|nr:hypothetical protein BEH94_03430 [Candidatus Altiarchaeales archaeon WOR_SM1_SCG]